MKKLFKKLTFDHLMFLLIILGVIFVFCNTGCKAQNPGNLPVMEYYDASGENFDVIVNEIPMYADGVVDFVYTPVDDLYSIEYNDQDAFDYDNLQFNGDEWYGDFIIIECDKELFFEYLEWFNTVTDDKSDAYYDMNDNFYIKEVITPVEGGQNYRYYLAKH